MIYECVLDSTLGRTSQDLRVCTICLWKELQVVSYWICTVMNRIRNNRKLVRQGHLKKRIRIGLAQTKQKKSYIETR
jgi:hypothetical protein